MKLFSTKNKKHTSNFVNALLTGLAPDGGLYMPANFPSLDIQSLNRPTQTSPLSHISESITKKWLSDEFDDLSIKRIINKALDFPTPLVHIHDNIYALELFHGPTMAFKDVGARFMASSMHHCLTRTDHHDQIDILVATSGDTGGAVAAGFFDVPGFRVHILFPKGKVSPFQQKQLTTWGSNVFAVAVSGSFDDCQRIVKSAFVDRDLSSTYRLSSANSINIGRLLPQSFYYISAVLQLQSDIPVTISVPSGNFGNLTAGMFAKRQGLPIHQFIAATNANNVVPNYLQTGKYKASKTIATFANAMDVGNPSNFSRILSLYGSTWNLVREDMQGMSVSDDQVLQTIAEVYRNFNYLLDPHSAIGYHALCSIKDPKRPGIFLCTAHPYKFSEILDLVDISAPIPDQASRFLNQSEQFFEIESDFHSFKEYLTSRF